jgi:hypothetical protein
VQGEMDRRGWLAGLTYNTTAGPAPSPSLT